MENVNTVVRVKQGELRGVIIENICGGQYLAFRGIPYAKPPVGQLRFKDPEPAEPWTGIRDASKFGDCCAQLDFVLRKKMGSDDCLYLNVNIPLSNHSKKLPVMVWIHGGAFVYGSGDDQFYGPDYIMRKDVILVTINYRLGVLGFLNLEHEIAPGNQGLKDQVLALRWVQENISNFGGDPNNVTIFGESAGSASVHYLCISPMAEGLFHKAISQSGVAANSWASIKNPKEYAFKLVEMLGKNTTDPEEIVEFLRTIDAQELALIQNKVIKNEDASKIFCAFGPSVDYASPNPFLTQPPLVAMKNGVKVPYLMGYNTREGSFTVFIIDSETMKLLLPTVDKDLSLVIHPEMLARLNEDGISLDDLKHIYFGDKPISKETLNEYADLHSDIFFLRNIFDVVNIQTEKKRHPTYLYEFSYDSPMSLMKTMFNMEVAGTTHADDLSYLFFPYLGKNLGLEPWPVDTTEYKIMEYFTEMWTNFAITGNPTPAKTDLIKTVWEPIDDGKDYKYLNINDELEMKAVRKGTQRFEWKKPKNKL